MGLRVVAVSLLASQSPFRRSLATGTHDGLAVRQIARLEAERGSPALVPMVRWRPTGAGLGATVDWLRRSMSGVYCDAVVKM